MLRNACKVGRSLTNAARCSRRWRGGKDNPSRGEPLYSVVIVPAKSSAVISGWHVSNQKTDEFLVTEYAKSASAALASKAKVGTITATFQAAWPVGSQPPADESGKQRNIGDGDATGFGRSIDQKYEEVRRELGRIRDSISVRYTK